MDKVEPTSSTSIKQMKYGAIYQFNVVAINEFSNRSAESTPKLVQFPEHSKSQH